MVPKFEFAHRYLYIESLGASSNAIVDPNNLNSALM